MDQAGVVATAVAPILQEVRLKAVGALRHRFLGMPAIFPAYSISSRCARSSWGKWSHDASMYWCEGRHEASMGDPIMYTDRC